MSFVSSEQDQVVFHSRRVIGECELELELVEQTEAGDGGVGHKGRVAKLIASAESGTSDTDGCNTNIPVKFSGILQDSARRNTADQKMALAPHSTSTPSCCEVFWMLLDDLFSNTITSSVPFLFHVWLFRRDSGKRALLQTQCSRGEPSDIQLQTRAYLFSTQG